MTEPRCWQCGIEPIDTIELVTFGERDPQILPVAWPDGDHPHAATPPSPDDLTTQGRRILDRIAST